jgi:hypothetical protein
VIPPRALPRDLREIFDAAQMVQVYNADGN